MRIFTETILRCASLLVPKSMRADWLAEWRAELWYVRERSHQNATRFCLGAFSDAACVFRSTRRDASMFDSALTCAAVLGFLTALCVLQLGSLPGGYAARVAVQSPKDKSLVALWRDGRPGIEGRAYAALKKRQLPLLSSLGFYQHPEKLEVTGVGEMSLAPATASLLEVLDVALPPATEPGHAVVLTRAALRRHAGGSELRTGAVLNVAGRPTRVAGIVPDYAGPFAREIDGWFVSEAIADAGSPVYILARLAPAYRSGRVRLPLRMAALPIANSIEQSTANFLLMTLLAVVLLPVATSWSVGELLRQRNRHLWFFLLKLSLVLVIAYCAAVNLSFARTSQAGSPLFVHAYLLAYILGLRWVICDQRSRCPTCLGRLGNAASIGESSRIFLDRNVTELVCARGHGLMHIPETPTSWFAGQRWLPLDASWQGLFTR